MHFRILGLFLPVIHATAIMLFLSLSFPLSFSFSFLFFKCCGSELSIPNLVFIGVWIIVLFGEFFNVFPKPLPNCRNEVLKNKRTLL